MQAPGPAQLVLALAPESLPGLLRLPGVQSRARPMPADMVWHDSTSGELEAEGLALARAGGRWTLERLHPVPQLPWPPAAPAPVLAEGDAPEALGNGIPAVVVPVAAFQGRLRRLRLAPEAPDGPAAELDVLEGVLRGVTAEAPVCQVVLRAPRAELARHCAALGDAVRLDVPRASLAAEALAVARGTEPPPRRLGAPEVPPDAILSDLVAHVLGHLTDVLLHWSRGVGAGETPEPVHQMRVAIRRLRSALSVFRKAAGCPELDRLGPELRELAARAGAARDWDVFLDGTGASVLAALPEDRRMASLLAAARRKREAAYAALRAELASPGVRTLGLDLACAAALRPWESAPEPERQETLRQDARAYAAQVLDRRMKRAAARAAGMAELPIEALHELRKECKRLRYAAECFAPLFPGQDARRFFKRLARLQEALGRLNDGAVAAALAAELGPAGRGFAGGAVIGFVAARAGDAREEIRREWKRLRRADAFWR